MVWSQKIIDKYTAYKALKRRLRNSVLRSTNLKSGSKISLVSGSVSIMLSLKVGSSGVIGVVFVAPKLR